MKYLRQILCGFTIVFFALFVHSEVGGQVLLLPSPARVSQGDGPCSDLVAVIASPNWRVRKGDVFEVWAIQPVATESNPSYSWKVSNGKILSGQGTSRIQIKAGNAKTPGFLNVTGFVSIAVVVESVKQGGSCAVEASHEVMIGRHRESNYFANVENVTLDETTLVHPCPPGRTPSEGRRVSDDSVISVTTIASDPENDVLAYSYSVSGGKIVGTGARVNWDLTNVAPGTYTLVAGVDDGNGIFGKTATKTITVDDCPIACGLIECPTVDISGPEKIEAGEIEVFTANVSGGAFDTVGYHWAVEGGEIVDGQGSPSVKVKIPLNKVDTTVTLSLGFPEPTSKGECQTVFSRVYTQEPL